MKLITAFESWIGNLTPSTGDYLADHEMTFEQAVEFYTIVHHGDVEKAKATAAKRIEDYKSSVGDMELYFFHRKPNDVEVLKCWRSQLDEMEATWEIEAMPAGPHKMAYLRRKS